MIRSLWINDRVVLRLEKWLENWYELYPDDLEPMVVSKNQIACEDVTNIPDEKLVELLDDIHYELIPDDYEEEQDNKARS